jgi:hypothetical protein
VELAGEERFYHVQWLWRFNSSQKSFRAVDKLSAGGRGGVE